MAAITEGTKTENGLVAESDLMYEGPDNTPEWNLKDAESDFIKSLASDETEAPELDEADPYGQDTAEPEIPKDAPEVEETNDEVDDPKLARGIQRVVQRELAAKAEREAADRSIAEMKVLKAEIEQYKGVKDVQLLRDKMAIDPYNAIKDMGHDPDTMIKLALAQQLGDQAPEKLKEFARDASTKREIAQLKMQLAQEAQTRRSQEYFNTIQAGAREYVTKVGDSTPTLATVAKADPDYARDEIMEEIVMEAKRQAATNPDGEPMTYQEAAKRVETRFSRLAKLLSVQNGKTTAINDKNAKKPTPPSSKPAAKPLAPWQKSTSNLEDDGIREAMREYERAEAARKASR